MYSYQSRLSGFLFLLITLLVAGLVAGLAACQPATDSPAFSDQYLLIQTVSAPGMHGELTSEAILQADYFTSRQGERSRLHVTPKWFSINPPHGSGLNTATPAPYMLEDEEFNTLLDWMFAGTHLHLDADGGIERIEPGNEAAHARIMARMPDNLGALYEQAPMLMRLPQDIQRGQSWEETRDMGDGTPLSLSITVLDFDDEEVLLSLDAGDPATALAGDTVQQPLVRGRMILRRDGDWPVELRLHMYLPSEPEGTPLSYAIRLASTRFSRYGFYDQDAITAADWVSERLATPDYSVPDDHELRWLKDLTTTDTDALQALQHSSYWLKDGDSIRLHSEPLPLFGYHMPMVTLRAARLLDHAGAPLHVETLLNRRFEQHIHSNQVWLQSETAPVIIPDPRTPGYLAETLGRIELDLDIEMLQPLPVAHLDHGGNADKIPGLADARWHDQGVDLVFRGNRTLTAIPLDQEGNIIPFDMVYLPAWLLAQLDPSQDDEDGLFNPDVTVLSLDNATHEVRLLTETPATRIALYIGEAATQRHTLVYRDGNDLDPETSDIRRYRMPASGLTPASPAPPDDGLDMAARVAALTPTCTDCDTFRLPWPTDTPAAVVRMCALQPEEQALYYGNPLAGYLDSTVSFSGSDAPVTELRTADDIIRHFHDLDVTVTLRCPARITYVTEAVAESECVTARGRSGLHIADTPDCAALRAASPQAQGGFDALDELGFPLREVPLADAADMDNLLRFHGPVSHVRYPRPEGEVTRQWSLHFAPLSAIPEQP
ncbi:hypothetical protein K8B33_01715 [Alcanivorax sp. JB21]|uniref:hypothetical protein n=1 Tax=Alcanivorax limicola TaxID=2874102 RepID=UPI001CBEAA31|nr:hypothetical protein [Alcanivorax limicola]MBZ2187804.1 hypothetical protein [Alcanivorax limicola]